MDSIYSFAMHFLDMLSWHHILVLSFFSHLICKCLLVKILHKVIGVRQTQVPHVGKNISLSACIRLT